MIKVYSWNILDKGSSTPSTVKELVDFYSESQVIASDKPKIPPPPIITRPSHPGKYEELNTARQGKIVEVVKGWLAEEGTVVVLLQEVYDDIKNALIDGVDQNKYYHYDGNKINIPGGIIQQGLLMISNTEMSRKSTIKVDMAPNSPAKPLIMAEIEGIKFYTGHFPAGPGALKFADDVMWTLSKADGDVFFCGDTNTEMIVPKGKLAVKQPERTSDPCYFLFDRDEQLYQMTSIVAVDKAIHTNTLSVSYKDPEPKLISYTSEDIRTQFLSDHYPVEMQIRKDPAQNVYLFTDPSCLGNTNINKKPFFTGSGDVDDVAAILLAAQIHGSTLTCIICDDKEGHRHTAFMEYLGDVLAETYKCKFMKEDDLKDIPENTRIHIHGPTSKKTFDLINSNRQNIHFIYTQGSTPNDTNFKFPTPNGATLLRTIKRSSQATFKSEATNFTIKRDTIDDEYKTGLSSNKAKEIYENYFTFNFRKKFGLPFDNPDILEMLFTTSDPSKGNGYKYLKAVANAITPGEHHKKWVDDTIAYYKEKGSITGSTKENLYKYIAALDTYCEYEPLLVDGKIPSMKDLGTVNIRDPPSNPGVKTIMDSVRLASTPLFDAVPFIQVDISVINHKFGTAYKVNSDPDNTPSPSMVDTYGQIIRKSLELFSRDSPSSSPSEGSGSSLGVPDLSGIPPAAPEATSTLSSLFGTSEGQSAPATASLFGTSEAPAAPAPPAPPAPPVASSKGPPWSAARSLAKFIQTPRASTPIWRRGGYTRKKK